MKPAAFSYHIASSPAAAIELLGRLGAEAKVIAGGQSLVPMMNLRLARPAHLIDIGGLAELAFIRDEGDHFAIGALTRHVEIERSAALQSRLPLLPAVARTIAHYAIRTQGTLGGSLAHADPAAQWPLAAVALGAVIQVRGPGGERFVPAGDFFLGAMSTVLASDELVVATRWPVPVAASGWGFELLARRRGDFALCAVVVGLALAHGRLASVRVTVGGVAPIPVDASSALAGLQGQPANEACAANVARAVAASIRTADDAKASAWYRTELIEALTFRATTNALRQTQEDG